jgi:hypothetical protein
VEALSWEIKRLIDEARSEAQKLREEGGTLEWTSKGSESGFISEALGVLPGKALLRVIDVDKETRDWASRINIEQRKPYGGKINEMCANANVDFEASPQDPDSIVKHFAKVGDDPHMGGGTPELRRVASPAKIARALEFAIFDPEAALRLKVNFDVKLEDVCETLLQLFPGIHLVYKMVKECPDLKTLLGRRDDLINSIHTFTKATVFIGGEHTTHDISLGINVFQSQAFLAGALGLQNPNMPDIESISCGCFTLQEGADKLALMHEIIESRIRECYQICLACFATGNYDKALAIAERIGEIRIESARDVDPGATNKCLFLSLFACIKAVDGLIKHMDLRHDDCRKALFEANELMTRALRYVCADNTPGFVLTTPAGAQLKKSMLRVLMWLEGMEEKSEEFIREVAELEEAS